MRIDRPDGDDHRPVADAPDTPRPRHAPDASDQPEASGKRETANRSETIEASPQPTDLRQQQLAEHARNRKLADAVYQAFEARKAWAGAVPELRAAWEDHKQRYPERSQVAPRTQSDGSWVADGNRRLSPEQNAEATKACADLREEAGQVILPAMCRVEAASPDGRLAGLDHMLKGEDRLKEKIADYLRAPGVTVRGAVDKVPDTVRFTLMYEPERYAEGVLGDIDRLKAEGFELIKLKNLWHADQYKGVNSQWRRPDTGLRFEMQFHTPESLEAKELTHEAYGRIRSETASAAEERELVEFQRRVSALLAIPPGTDRIKDFPE